MTDDQGYGDLGVHGNVRVRTPNIDRFALAGTRFNRFYVSPLCAPTRASLLTGRYSLRMGVKGVTRGEETMPREEVTVAEALRSAGYRTGLFGKWHNGENFPYTPPGQGFDESLGFNLGHWNNYFDTTLEHNGRPTQTRGFITDVLTDAALGFLEANRDRPFFCYVAFNTPHSPLQVPARYFDRYKAMGLDDRLASVYGLCENIDDNVGRLLAKLDDLALRKDTIVVYMSDNGPAGVRYNAGMRGAKGSLHEGGSRVPCFLAYPARFPKPQTVTQIAAHIDLLPTILELCKVPLPTAHPLDGRSLVPLLEGNSGNWPDRTLFCQHQPPRPNGRQTGALRTQRYRLVNEGKGWQLFDMVEDPGQSRDIGDREPAKKAELIEQYDRWWATVLPGALRPVPPIPVGYAEEDPVELAVPQARFDGSLRFFSRHPNNNWLTGWTNLGDTVVWDVDVVRAGTYEASLLYLTPAADAGARVQVTAGGVSAETTLAGTPIRQISSPDRVPRDEVYEMEWATQAVGKLLLSEGKTTVTVQALSKPGRQVMDLKAVLLKRVDPSRP